MADLETLMEIPSELSGLYEQIALSNLPPAERNTLNGANTAALTPVDADGNFDRESFLRYYRWFIPRAKIRSLLIGGFTGEGDSLSLDNYLAALSAANELKQESGIKIIAGIFQNDSAKILARADAIKDLQGQYDYLLIAPPIEEKLHPNQFIRLIKDIQNIGIERPLVIYRTGLSKTQFTLKTLTRIYEATGGWLAAVKDTTDENKALFRQYVLDTGLHDKFELIQGNDHLFYQVFRELYSHGQDYVGNISGFGNTLVSVQLRHIMAAAIRNSLDGSLPKQVQRQYDELAKSINSANEELINNTARVYKGYVGYGKYNSKAEPPILKKMISLVLPWFPTKPANPQLLELNMEGCIPDLSAKLEHYAYARNNYLQWYKRIQEQHIGN